jgi:hypothetical protein
VLRSLRYSLAIGWVSLLPVTTFIFSNLDDGSIKVRHTLLTLGFLAFSSVISLIYLSAFKQVNFLRFATSIVVVIYCLFNYRLTSKVADQFLLTLERGGLILSFIRTHPIYVKLFLWSVFCLFLLLLIRIVHRRSFFEPFVKIFSLFTAVLIFGQIAYSVVSIVSSEYSSKPMSRSNWISSENKPYPDVMILVIDSLPNDIAQQDFFERKDRNFSNELENLGFVIADQSRSNYLSTAVSVSSLLNMDYHEVDKLDKGNSYFYSQLSSASTGSMLFKEYGYSVGLAPSGVWSGWACGGAEDFCVNPAKSGWLRLDEFTSSLLSLTPFGDAPLLDLRFTDLGHLYSQASKSRSEPIVLFIHGMEVHAPFNWNEKCEATRPRKDNVSFIASIECFEMRVLEQLETIPDDVVVVIQADHGTGNQAHFSEVDLPSRVSQNDQRFFAYSALRLPEICRSTVPSNLTPVNVLRITSNCLFDKKEPLLENRFFVGSVEVLP